MSEVNEQNLRSGAHSNNVQANQIHVHQGPSASEIAEIIEQVSDRNIERYSERAQRLVDERLQFVKQSIVEELASRETLSSVADPGMQYAVLTVQKEFARTGDENLSETLVQMLGDRSQTEQRSRRQLILDESLQVVGRLTQQQIDALSFALVVRRPRPQMEIGNHEQFEAYCRSALMPWIAKPRLDDLDYHHLDYTGCASIAAGSCTVASAFKQVWPSLWHQGWDVEQIPESLRPHLSNVEIFLPALRDRTKFQANAMNKFIADIKAEAFELNAAEFSGLVESGLMEEDKIDEDMKSRIPEWDQVLSAWNDTQMKNLELTSVGITIGHANARRLLGSELIGGLEVYGL